MSPSSVLSHTPRVEHHSPLRTRFRCTGCWLIAAGALSLVFLAPGIQPSTGQEIAWLKRLANTDDAGAQLQLGLAYRDGRYGLTPNDELGRQWLERSARNGDAYAAGMVERTTAASKTMVPPGKADMQADHSELDRLAVRFDSPMLKTAAEIWKVLSLSSTEAQSAETLQSKAISDDPLAEFQLAMRYRNGAWGVNRNPDKALYWLRRSAHAGNPVAMRTLAQIYQAGSLGVPHDPERAARWLARATVAASQHG